MYDDILFFERPIHLNYFARAKFNLEEEDKTYLLEFLALSLDGAVMGVKLAKVEPYFTDPMVREIRLGCLKMPERVELTSEEDLFKLLAMLIPLDEYC